MDDRTVKDYAAFLFDVDGTLIRSVVAAERVWSRWAREKGLDVEAFLKTIHGVRSIDTIRRLGRRLGLPGLDIEAEAARIERDEIAELDGIVAIPGVVDFLAALPPERWAIVTSASLALATARLGAAGLSLPKIFVTAEDVTDGKPDPQGYRLAAARLGVDPADCLVFEDAPAGIQAGERAGADILVITATHSAPHGTGHAECRDYRGLSVRTAADGRMALAFAQTAE